MDFESLYRTYYMKVYSYVMTLVRNPHLAEEITQETFFKALKTKSPCKNRSGELTWLCAIAKRACIDEQRRQRHLSGFSLGNDAASEDAPEEAMAARAAPDQGISPQNVEQIVEDAQCSLLLHQLLHDLEEPYKEVFHLRTFGELSFQNIGQIFGKTEVWARVTYHRARLKLIERMEKHGSEERM